MQAVLLQLSTMRGEVLSRQVSALEDISTPRMGHSSVALVRINTYPELVSCKEDKKFAILLNTPTRTHTHRHCKYSHALVCYIQ